MEAFRNTVPLREIERRPDVFVGIIERLRPIRGMPIWARYASSGAIVLLFFMARYLLSDIQGSPFLLFLPAIVISSFLFDRGSGFFATLLSTALAIYFFIEPRDNFRLQDIGSILAVVVFLLVGLFSAAVIEALRTTVDTLVSHETVLGNSLTLLEALLEGVPDPIFVKDREGRFVRANSALAKIFGVPADLLRGKRDQDFMPHELSQRIESVDREVMDNRRPSVVEELIPVAGGGERYYLSTKAPWFGRRGEVVGLLGISRDIHERRQAESEIRTANAQKEVLLHDINHRVKNHLQSVMSLLEIGKRRLPDPQAKAEIESAVSRLSVLVRVYDRLRVHGDAVSATVRIRDYIEGLCDELGPTMIGLRPVVLRTQVEDFELEAGQAVSVGLAVNELVQNSLKHAFPDDRPGAVTVSLKSGEIYVLEVSDDGIGAKPQTASGGTGTRIVKALAQQLGGKIDWAGPPGTRVTLSWPKQS